jgi:pilus assembly protein CpaF
MQALLAERGLSVTDPAARALARAELKATPEEIEEFFGHGPLKALLEDERITEVLVNGPGEIWVERAGRLQRHHPGFAGEESLKRYARRLLSAHGKKADQRSPFSDAVLEGGVRLHVAVPPVSRKGICLSFRKPPRVPWTLNALEKSGALSGSSAALLREMVRARKNIFICGGTGSGKTSLLSALLAEVSHEERILALEDVAEIRVEHPHFLSLEARFPNQEGEGEVPLPKLLREALRMRPDRLVMGECRGAEAVDLLMALSTGHPGSMGTIHSNSPRDALHRLEILALLAAENLGEGALKALIASCVHVVVHLERVGAQRRLSAVAEIKGVDGGNYLLREAKPG